MEGHFVIVIRDSDKSEKWWYVNDESKQEILSTEYLNSECNPAVKSTCDPVCFVYKRRQNLESYYRNKNSTLLLSDSSDGETLAPRSKAGGASAGATTEEESKTDSPFSIKRIVRPTKRKRSSD